MRTTTALPHDTQDVGKLWDGTHGNFDKQRLPISLIILHSMDGSTTGSTAWFKKQDLSAHYGVSKDGKLTAWIPEDCVAYHAGKYSVNQYSLGIEHEDAGDNQASRTPEEIETSAQLLADFSRAYGIPLDRNHVKLHNEIVPTQCPGNLPIDAIIARAKAILAPTQAMPDGMVAAGEPDGKPPVLLTQTLFERLVTKSGSWDDVGTFFSLTEDQKRQVGAGKQVVDELRTWRDRLNSTAVSPVSVPTTQPTGMTIATATDPRLALNGSSSSYPVPSNPVETNSPSVQDKNLLFQDLSTVVARFRALFGGKQA